MKMEKTKINLSGLLHDSFHFLVLIAVLFFIFRFVIGLSVVEDKSMEPQLERGDLVVYFRPVRKIRQGDVVAIRVPSGYSCVDRVAAVGGDTVDLSEGKVYVNGEELADGSAHGMTAEQSSAVIYPYPVRDGSAFVLGDNREAALDSRTFGEVSRRQIRGRALLRIGKGRISLFLRQENDQKDAAVQDPR